MAATGLNPVVAEVTIRIRARSSETRTRYLERRHGPAGGLVHRSADPPGHRLRHRRHGHRLGHPRPAGHHPRPDPHLTAGPAIGAGSLFFSHVNDAGFWLVKEYFGLSVGQTIKTWSIMETLISVVGLVFVLLLSLVV